MQKRVSARGRGRRIPSLAATGCLPRPALLIHADGWGRLELRGSEQMVERVKVGVPLFLLRPERMPEVAQRAEELGFESVWLPEHVIFPAEIRSPYPYAPGGRPPIVPTTPLLDPMVLLAFVAARTRRIRLGTNVFLPALRHPIASARMIVTLDLVSGGRLSLGVGAGWLAEEFVALQVDFATRGARLRECVRAWKVLWSDESPSFRGRFFCFERVKFEPKPVQKPHPPVVFGGESETALRRAAQLGNGWYGVRHTPESAARQVARLRALLAEYGRQDEPFEVTVSAGPVDELQCEEFARAGVHRVVVLPWQRDREAEERLEQLARTLRLG